MSLLSSSSLSLSLKIPTEGSPLRIQSKPHFSSHSEVCFGVRDLIFGLSTQVSAMTASAESARTRTGRRPCIGARGAVFLLWVAVVFSVELILLLAVQDKSTTATTSRSISPEMSAQIGATTSSDRSAASSVKSLPRKAKTFHAVTVHAPSNPSSDELANANGDPDPLYEEDKRIIHTGPNPLHN